MKTKEYFAPLLKWWWLLLLAAVIAGVSAYITTQPLPPVYLARTTLVAGNFISSLNPTNDELNLSMQLAQTYSDIANRESIQAATRQALGLNALPDYEAQPLSTGPFIEIAVTYNDPAIAQAVANELANQVILASPSSSTQSDQERINFIEGQLNDIQEKITTTQDEINQKRSALSELSSAVEISQTQSELTALETRLTSMQQIYVQLQSSLPTSARNVITIYESAELPTRPIGPNKPLIIALAALAGMAVAGGAAYGIEALDTSIKSSEEVSRLIDLPVIGRVSVVPGGSKNTWTFSSDQPQSLVAEDFRLLRTNLEFFGVDSPIKTFMISSPDVGDGKSTVSTNLATVISLAEKNVILVDADFRRPVLHEVLGLGKPLGLSDVISHGLDYDSVLIPWKDNPYLRILPAGMLPPNPAELLGSHRMETILADLASMADVVIVDGPPFIVADALVLASRVDALLLVLRPGHSHRSAVSAMREQLGRVSSRVLGVVLNQMPSHSSYYRKQYRVKQDKARVKLQSEPEDLPEAQPVENVGVESEETAASGEGETAVIPGTGAAALTEPGLAPAETSKTRKGRRAAARSKAAWRN